MWYINLTQPICLYMRGSRNFRRGGGGGGGGRGGGGSGPTDKVLTFLFLVFFLIVTDPLEKQLGVVQLLLKGPVSV